MMAVDYVMEYSADQQPTAGAHSNIKSTIKGLLRFQRAYTTGKRALGCLLPIIFCSVVDPCHCFSRKWQRSPLFSLCTNV